MAVTNLSNLLGKNVYTKAGKYVGKIDDTMLDSERGAVYGVVVQVDRASFLFKMLEKGGEIKKAVLIPHRHITACEDIVVVSMPKRYEAPLAAPMASAPMDEPSTAAIEENI